jgi:hypothetical protein
MNHIHYYSAKNKERPSGENRTALPSFMHPLMPQYTVFTERFPARTIYMPRTLR